MRVVNTVMNTKYKKDFKYVFYVVQTSPIFKTCGHTFSKKIAQSIANEVYNLTGTSGHIIKFSREELITLNYERTNSSR